MKYLLCIVLSFICITSKAQENTPSAPPQEVKPFVFVEEMPSFAGGYEVYIAQNVKYPVHALSNGIQGTVYVQIVIDETGKVISSKIVKGVDSSLNNESLRVISSMPNWTPGRTNGKAVPVQMNIPIKFTLREQDEQKK